MNELVDVNSTYGSLADKLDAVVPLGQTLADDSFINGMNHGTVGEFRRKYRITECHTAAHLVNHTLNAFPANLNTGEQFTFMCLVFPRKKGIVNARIGSNSWLQENLGHNFGEAAFGGCMSHHGEHHFTVLTIALMITPSLLPTTEGWRQHNEALHSLIHHSHGQLGTDLTQTREDPILLMNARVCSPYVRAFMALVRSPLYTHMLYNKIAPVFVFRGMLIQSPRAGQYVLSTQDSGRHGHTLIAIVGGVQGCAGAERFKSLDHFPRHMHTEYQQDGQGNDLPRVTNDATDATEQGGFVTPLATTRVRPEQRTTPGVSQRLFGPTSSSPASAAGRRASPYGTSESATSSWLTSRQSSAGSPYSSPTMSLTFSSSTSSSSSSSPAYTAVSTAAAVAVAPSGEPAEVSPTPAADVVDLTASDEALDRLMAHIENNYEEFTTREFQQ